MVDDWSLSLAVLHDDPTFVATLDSTTHESVSAIQRPTVNNGRTATVSFTVSPSAVSGSYWVGEVDSFVSQASGSPPVSGGDSYHRQPFGVYVP